MADIRPLTLKAALLLALASVTQVGDLQALSVSPACLEFGPNDSKFFLKSRHGYIPNLCSERSGEHIITLFVLPPSEDDQESNLLYPVRALSVPPRSGSHNNSLYTSEAGLKGHLVMKQRQS